MNRARVGVALLAVAAVVAGVWLWGLYRAPARGELAS